MKRLTAVAALLVLLLPPLAHANSRLPETNQLVVAPDDKTHLLLRATFGFLFSTDNGVHWDWLCEQAIPVSGSQDPAVAVLAGGTVLSAQVEGLASSPDLGCSWSFVPGTAQQIVPDVARSSDGHTAIAITNTYAHTTDAGTLLYASRMVQTTSSGKSWVPLPGAIDPLLAIDTIDLAASDPLRIYVTGTQPGSTTAKMLVSADGGMSYQEHDIPLAAGETGAFIAAVDPNIADRVYLRTIGMNSSGIFSRLLVTTDGGGSFKAYWSGDKMLGFALSQDGSRVYLGSSAAGLLAANASDLVFSQRSPISVQCLMTFGSTLYVCSNEASTFSKLGTPFILAATANEGTSFSPLLALAGIRGPLSCPPSSPATVQCGPLWPALARSFGIDAGAPAPAADAGAATSGCGGCEADNGSTRSSTWLVLPAAVLLFLRARRRRARSRS